MDNYNRKQMMIPKTTKAAIMIFFAPIVDVLILLCSCIISIRISQIFNAVPTVQIVVGICGLLIGISIIKRSKAAPNMRNWRVLFFVLLQDTAKFLPISVTEKSQKELQTKKKEGTNSLINNTKKKQKEAERELKNTLSLNLPINCTEDGILTYANGKASRFLQLDSTDLFNLPDAGLREWQDSLTKVSRTYVEDCSYISMASRIDMSNNQQYWRYLRQKCDSSPAGIRRARDLTEKITAADNIECRTDLYSSKKYYVELFGNSVKEVRSRTAFYKMGAPKLKPSELDRKQTINVLHSINNPINE
ncbi:hypothetical protein [Lactobacillus bombicola]|uniref:PAS domain-containing protein n=1 Tax=Lactobacillus bombicola TaxID=1505723 RepID=A0A396ST16_9LACO|nr:hypothetical protein [Lactobacillus bombicola]RHW55052.1 hypothetical protein DS835_01375 [Lactobacillus bombicola]